MSLVGTTIDNSFENITLELDVYTVARKDSNDISLSVAAPTYYVELSGNLNTFVDVSLSGADDIDDAWALSAFGTVTTVNQTEQIGAVTINNTVSQVKLGKTSDINDFANFSLLYAFQNISGSEEIGRAEVTTSANIDNNYNLVSSSNGGTDFFKYRVYAEVGTNGLLSFNHHFDDTSNKTYSLNETFDEDTTLAQQLYFQQIWSGLNTTTSVATSSLGLTDVSDDLFEVTVGVNNALSTELDTELAGVSGETLLTSLHFTVDAISLDNDNKLSQWANLQGYNGNDDSKLFEDGQVIWVNQSGLTKNIGLTMNKYDNTSSELFNMDIGVKLVQGTTGARA